VPRAPPVCAHDNEVTIVLEYLFRPALAAQPKGEHPGIVCDSDAAVKARRENGPMDPPERLRFATERGTVAMERLGDVVAVHNRRGGPETFSVVPADAAETGDGVGPVYRQQPGGELVAPTGRVLVRFGEGESADERSRDLERAGYAIERALPYAPHAAWVQPATGRISDALSGLDRLERLNGVVHVEPQVLRQMAQRR